MKSLFVFDLDGTLAPSKSALGTVMASLLGDLLDVMKVAVISGGNWHQFETQLVTGLPPAANLGNLSLLPTCGTQFYEYTTTWSLLYSEVIAVPDRNRIVHAMTTAIDESQVEIPRLWGEQIEDRESQITLSLLGQDAPIAEKSAFDADFAKRESILAILRPLIPEFAAHMGGTTSIDVTRPGIDKAYGIAKLATHLHIPIADMIFAGDAIFPGGNDFPVQQAGVDSIGVGGPDECALVVQAAIGFASQAHDQILSLERRR